ncbi:MAG: septum formation inhibitor Maf [Firmicutes bacterium]|nr:septum formation inhibitor Maf [Bacillota bacterium]
MSRARVWLASTSPRRQAVLRQLGIAFEVLAPQVDEEAIGAATPEQLALARARAKARDAARRVDEGFVIGADTVVALDGEVLGKPSDAAEAVRMLERLSGRRHTVVTGVCIVRRPDGREHAYTERSEVEFTALDRATAAAYAATGEPLDKAGAYAVQGLGAAFVRRIEGSFYAVVGLPAASLVEALREMGWTGFLADAARAGARGR